MEEKHEIEIEGKVYEVIIEIFPQPPITLNCVRCGNERVSGYLKAFDIIEVKDSDTTTTVERLGLRKSILAEMMEKESFKPICCDCLEKQSDEDAYFLRMQQIQRGEYDEM